MEQKESQEQELEALTAIYSDTELTVHNNEYPSISLSVTLSPNEDENLEEEEEELSVTLNIELPADYPDVVPELSVEGVDEIFGQARSDELLAVLQKCAEDNVGMVMVFTIVCALQEEIGKLVDERKQLAEKAAEEEKAKVEAIAMKKFEGTRVTQESFLKWKTAFDKEREALKEKQQQEREAALAGRLTGRQLFLKDATLSLSDIALTQGNVEIDESLFDDGELEGLELDSDEDK